MIPSDPYPWPWSGTLDPRRLALVIAGDQPAWARRSVGAGETAVVIAHVAGAVRGAGGLVVHVRHGRSVSPRGGLPPARGAAGWAVAGPVAAGGLVVDATGIDGFYDSPLDQELRDRGVDTLVMAGYGGEATVSSTLRSANDRGYECLTLVDGVAMFDPCTGASTLHSITMSGGIFGAIAPSTALVPSLMEAVPC